ncbi:MAG TPA: hypothetical protein VLG11_00095 [Candidatus Saccharimonadales bacterium]|nr:hypothetical protein [Candidatus Saccharimonadales bacterium]
MALMKTRITFADSDEGEQSKQKLKQMVASSLYNTTATYSANSSLYPDNLMPFIDKHMNYLISHPLLDPVKYIANIKLMTKLR